MGKKYTLTDEHRAQLAPWADKWIANAMSTAPMDDADRDAMRVAVRGLYEATGLTPPPDHRIVFVPSPFVGRFAAGFAAWIWYKRTTTAATRAATYAATAAATRDATRAATYAATAAAAADATYAATYDATRAATAAATDDAAYVATYDATRDATDDATAAATADATATATDVASRGVSWCHGVDLAGIAAVATAFGDRRAMLQCASYAWRMQNGGNQWSAWAAFLSFFRHVAKLPLDYSKWQHYEAAAMHGGQRWMHREFCIVSDRPEVLKVDAENRPHNDDGPFCRWRDGSALYAVHGVRVPWWIIEQPERLTAERITAETNAEVRRVMMDRFGHDRYIRESGAALIDDDPTWGKLWRADVADDEPLVVAELVNSTAEPDGSFKTYWLRVPPTTATTLAAVAWTFDVPPSEYAMMEAQS